MTTWPQDNESALIAFYGDPGRGQVEPQLVHIAPPFRMTYEGAPVPHLVFHKKAADALLAALNTVWDYYGHDQAKLDSLGISKTAGTFNPRKIAGSDRWSNHAFGAAIDINADDNGFYKGHGNIPTPMIAAFKAQGARWGGDYKGRTDPMHFEFCESGEPRESFEAWLSHYGVKAPPSAPVVVAPSPPAAPTPAPADHAPPAAATPPLASAPAAAAPADATPPAITDAIRHTMAKHILDFEARRDHNGHLMVYQLPSDDGGGSYEVAGINERFDGPMAAKLKAMVEAGQFDAAETEAENYILGNTNPAADWTTNAGVEFYLRDCLFNRGVKGAARILQHACGVSAAWHDSEDDGQIGPKTHAAMTGISPVDLLTRLRAAREDYERVIVGYRANFWNGLVNRWNNSLTVAQSYLEPTS